MSDNLSPSEPISCRLSAHPRKFRASPRVSGEAYVVAPCDREVISCRYVQIRACGKATVIAAQGCVLASIETADAPTANCPERIVAGQRTLTAGASPETVAFRASRGCARRIRSSPHYMTHGSGVLDPRCSRSRRFARHKPLRAGTESHSDGVQELELLLDGARQQARRFRAIFEEHHAVNHEGYRGC